MLSDKIVKNSNVRLRKINSEVEDIKAKEKKKNQVKLELTMEIKDEVTDNINIRFNEKIQEVSYSASKILNIDLHFFCQLFLTKKIDTGKLKEEDHTFIGNLLHPFVIEIVAYISHKMGRVPLIIPREIPTAGKKKDESKIQKKK